MKKFHVLKGEIEEEEVEERRASASGPTQE